MGDFNFSLFLIFCKMSMYIVGDLKSFMFTNARAGMATGDHLVRIPRMNEL